ncbi:MULTISPECIES: entericidin A/B family lipoprotein [unclassified Marinovum]
MRFSIANARAICGAVKSESYEMRNMKIAGLLLAVLALAGCETVKGAGRDMQSAGRVVERAVQ